MSTTVIDALRPAATEAARCANALCRAVLRLRPDGKPDQVRRFCCPCYRRWRRAGFPASGPGAPLSRSEAAARINARRSLERQWRLEDYAELIMWGETNEMAAKRVGISPAWAYLSYRPELRRRGGGVRTMPRRSTRESRGPGPILTDCLCRRGMEAGKVCCKPCWVSVPVPLRDAHKAARREGSVHAVDRAAEAIRKHLREAVRA